SRSACRRSAHSSPCLRPSPRSIQVASQALGLPAAPQLLLGLALDLPDALPGEAQALADLLQRARLLAVQAEAHADDLALLLVEVVHDRLDLLLEGGADQLELHRRNALLLERVAQLDAAVLAHGRRERDVVAGHAQQVLHLLLAE